MEWLKKYTFPAECSFQDLAAAAHRYSLLVKRFLSNGTTTAMYYGSLHLAPNKVLVDTIEALGQRAVVGKVRGERADGDGEGERADLSIRFAPCAARTMHHAPCLHYSSPLLASSRRGGRTCKQMRQVMMNGLRTTTTSMCECVCVRCKRAPIHSNPV